MDRRLTMRAWAERLAEVPEASPEWDVFGDWLLTVGDRRGELVRLTRRLATIPPGPRLAAAWHEHGALTREFHSWTAADLDRVLASPHLGGLTALVLQNCRLTADEAAAIATGPDRAALRELTFRCAREEATLGPDIALALADAPAPRLTHLTLEGCGIDVRGAEALARSPHVGALVRLDLSNNAVGDEGVAAIAASTTLPGLRELLVRRTRITPEGAAAVARSPQRRTLTLLSLEGNDVRDAGVTALAAGQPRALTSLDLSSTRIGSAGIDALASTGCLPELHSLDVSHNELTWGDAGRLVSSPQRVGLRELNLTRNPLGPLPAAAPGVSAALSRLDLSTDPQLDVVALLDRFGLDGVGRLSVAGSGVEGLGLGAPASVWRAHLTARA